MSKDLTNSSIHRQNILNNPYALQEIEKAAHVQGIAFEGRSVVIKEQVAAFFEVTPRTVDNYIEQFSDELRRNGYEVLRGKRLKTLKLAILGAGGNETDFLTKTTVLGVFDFRAFLNLAMLMVESERARLLRQAILDIVIDSINERTGGGTKYINQRDEAREYRKILRLHEKDKVRDTFYAEILDLIASYECGVAVMLQEEMKAQKRKLSAWEVDAIFSRFEKLPHWKPLIEKARNKMASRDLAFRDALHRHLQGYITPLQRDEFERFLGEKSKELAERLEEAKDVMKRLKERD
jgi:hypothetical protein